MKPYAKKEAANRFIAVCGSFLIFIMLSDSGGQKRYQVKYLNLPSISFS